MAAGAWEQGDSGDGLILRVLGPTTLERDGQSVGIGGPRQRAVDRVQAEDDPLRPHNGFRPQPAVEPDLALRTVRLHHDVAVPGVVGFGVDMRLRLPVCVNQSDSNPHRRPQHVVPEVRTDQHLTNDPPGKTGSADLATHPVCSHTRTHIRLRLEYPR